jgi:hypothetical protein
LEIATHINRFYAASVAAAFFRPVFFGAAGCDSRRLLGCPSSRLGLCHLFSSRLTDFALWLCGRGLRRLGAFFESGVSGPLRRGHFAARGGAELAPWFAGLRRHDGRLRAVTGQQSSKFGNPRVNLGLLKLETGDSGLDDFGCKFLRHIFIFDSVACVCQAIPHFLNPVAMITYVDECSGRHFLNV